MALTSGEAQEQGGEDGGAQPLADLGEDRGNQVRSPHGDAQPRDHQLTHQRACHENREKLEPVSLDPDNATGEGIEGVWTRVHSALESKHNPGWGIAMTVLGQITCDDAGQGADRDDVLHPLEPDSAKGDGEGGVGADLGVGQHEGQGSHRQQVQDGHDAQRAQEADGKVPRRVLALQRGHKNADKLIGNMSVRWGM